MVPVPLSRLQPSRKEEIEDWPWLDQAVLRGAQTLFTARVTLVCLTDQGAAARLPAALRVKFEA